MKTYKTKKDARTEFTNFFQIIMEKTNQNFLKLHPNDHNFKRKNIISKTFIISREKPVHRHRNTRKPSQDPPERCSDEKYTIFAEELLLALVGIVPRKIKKSVQLPRKFEKILLKKFKNRKNNIMTTSVTDKNENI